MVKKVVNQHSVGPQSPHRSKVKLVAKLGYGSIEPALRYDSEDIVGDVVRGNLAIAYLLESVSQNGFHPIDQTIALGLAEASRHYAEVTSHYLVGKAAARSAVHEASKTGRDLFEAISHAGHK